MKDWMGALENIVWLTQLGLSVLLPPVFFLWLAWWLTSSRGMGGWVYVPALVLGLGCGASSFFRFCRMVQRKAAQKRKDAPVSFNRHK